MSPKVYEKTSLDTLLELIRTESDQVAETLSPDGGFGPMAWAETTDGQRKMWYMDWEVYDDPSFASTRLPDWVKKVARLHDSKPACIVLLVPFSALGGVEGEFLVMCGVSPHQWTALVAKVDRSGPYPVLDWSAFDKDTAELKAEFSLGTYMDQIQHAVWYA